MGEQLIASARRTPTVVRRPHADDVATIARIWHAGWIDGHAGDVPPELARHRGHDQFLSRAARRLDDSWVATVGGVVVGFVTIAGDEVEQIYVDRAARGTGVAADLLRVATAAIGAGGHARAWLAVVAGNRRARAFYAREGWHDAGRMAYAAETGDGPLLVATHRYEIELGAT